MWGDGTGTLPSWPQRLVAQLCGRKGAPETECQDCGSGAQGERAWMVGAGQEDEPSIKDAPLKTGKNSGVALQAGSVLSP